jgi:hypothetical protein
MGRFPAHAVAEKSKDQESKIKNAESRRAGMTSLVLLFAL